MTTEQVYALVDRWKAAREQERELRLELAQALNEIRDDAVREADQRVAVRA